MHPLANVSTGHNTKKENITAESLVGSVVDKLSH